MILKPWDKLPKNMQVPEAKEYYDILAQKKTSLFLKRFFDIIMAVLLLVLLLPFLLLIAIFIRLDSPGTIFYRQERVTQYGRHFFIHKFRTMVMNADQFGTEVTTDQDRRITKIGNTLRKYRLDELPQLIDILYGDMTFVGTRPEVPRFVEQYTNEMLATLLLPAGVTSEASIEYKDEAELLDGLSDDEVNRTYVEKILPEKMKYNLEQINHFSIWNDLKTMIRTVKEVL